MENFEYLKIGGTLGLALIIIWQIVKANLLALKQQRESFTKILENHLVHDQELHEKTIEAMDKLAATQEKNTTAQEANALLMREMLNFLKNNKRR